MRRKSLYKILKTIVSFSLMLFFTTMSLSQEIQHESEYPSLNPDSSRFQIPENPNRTVNADLETLLDNRVFRNIGDVGEKTDEMSEDEINKRIEQIESRLADSKSKNGLMDSDDTGDLREELSRLKSLL